MVSRALLGFQVQNVTCIQRRGIGNVYRAVMTLADIGDLLKGNHVRYAPKYQRGFKPRPDDWDESLYDELLPINDKRLQLDWNRASQIAIKYLQGRLYNSDLTWNARKVHSELEYVKYEAATESLLIDFKKTAVTIPDSGHRHLAYFLLCQWFADDGSIPAQVKVDEVPVSYDQIQHLMADFDPDKEFVYCEIFSLTAEREGFLYDEFNVDQKKPSTTVAIELNPGKNPSRRFIYALMDTSRLFDRREIECRNSSIGSKSRKLTTNATLEAAVRPMKQRLSQLEGKPEWDDLLGFVALFFEEWAAAFPAWRPEASADERHELRKRSFALANVLMYPLFKLAFRLWEEYNRQGTDWRTDRNWKAVIDRLAGYVPVDSEMELGCKVRVMDRANREWMGRIVLIKEDEDGTRKESVTNTRPSQDSAYDYLCKVAGLEPSTGAGGRRKQKAPV